MKIPSTVRDVENDELVEDEVAEALELVTRAAIARWEMLVKSKIRALGERT